MKTEKSLNIRVIFISDDLVHREILNSKDINSIFSEVLVIMGKSD
jgi:hypothetical protein